MNKKFYYDNRSLKYGPSEFAGIGAGKRILVIGSAIDLAAEEAAGRMSSLNQYFHYIICENRDYLINLGSTVADILVLSRPSAYSGSVFDWFNRPELQVANIKALDNLTKTNTRTTNYTLAYIPVSDDPSSSPVLTGGDLPVGLSSGKEGLHIASIMGATDIYDTAARSGYIAADIPALTTFLSEKMVINGGTYNISPYFIGADRPTLITQI